jgi:small subunit ribosomal protein S13
MVYIFESELLENKSVQIALTQIFGIGNSNSILICKNLGFAKNFKVKNLSKEQLNLLLKIVGNLDLSLANDLKKEKLLAFKKLISIKSYRGLRRNQGLPVRGQRTHTNAKTAKRRNKS